MPWPAPREEGPPRASREQAGPPERRSRYELHLPYTIVLRLGWGGERGMVYFFASQPVALGARFGQQDCAIALRIRPDPQRRFRALRSCLTGDTLALGLHAGQNGLRIFLGQVRAPNSYILDADAETAHLFTDLAADRGHDPPAIRGKYVQ